jgi:hypothetical protein
VNLAITVSFSDRSAPLACRTRDVSDSGLYLDVDPATLDVSAGGIVTMSLLDDARRRGAMALYVTSGWDVRFASDLATTREALAGFRVDAIVAEHDLDDPRWPKLLEEVRRQQPMARRVVRAALQGKSPPPTGQAEDLVHCIVDVEAGLDAFVAAITDS